MSWHKAIDEWGTENNIHSDLQAELKDSITNGFKIKFINDLPPPPNNTGKPVNNSSCRNNEDIIREKLKAWTDAHKITKRDKNLPPPSHVYPITIATKRDKKRVCIDLSSFNEYNSDAPFHYQNIKTVLEFCEKDCFFAKLDIKECFMSLPLSEESKYYFNIFFEGEYYTFHYIMFGWKLAPYYNELCMNIISYKMTKQQSSVIPTQENGNHSHFVDDFLLKALSEYWCNQFAEYTARVFGLLGFTEALEKRLHANKITTYLGIVFNSIEACCSIPEDKLSRMTILCTTMLLDTNRVSRQDLRKLAGTINNFCQLVPTLKTFTKNVNQAAHNRHRRQRQLIDRDIIDDIQTWITLLPRLNGKFFWNPDIPTQTIHIQSDSNLTGFGFHILSAPQEMWTNFAKGLKEGHGTVGEFSPGHEPLELPSKIQWGELLALLYPLSIIAETCANARIIIDCDNEAIVQTLKKNYSRTTDCSLLCQCVALLKFEYNLVLEIRHIDGVKNTVADYLSRYHTYEKIDRDALQNKYKLHHIRFTDSKWLVKELKKSKLLQEIKLPQKIQDLLTHQ